MADVFISYERFDAGAAAELAELMSEAGLTVFQDRAMRAREDWRFRIEDELREAACVVVLWSTKSVSSDWVKQEAEIGRNQEKLVPVLLGRVTPPLGFANLHALRLDPWPSSAADPIFAKLLGEVLDPLPRSRRTEIQAKNPPPTQIESRSMAGRHRFDGALPSLHRADGALVLKGGIDGETHMIQGASSMW